jgi:glycosyltransferase involved in cell wall biosynthesis
LAGSSQSTPPSKKFFAGDMSSNTVYILVLNGSLEQATELLRSQYPDAQFLFVDKRRLREKGWKGQLRELSSLRGTAFVYFAQSMNDFVEPLLLAATGLIHRCQETVLADSAGNFRRFRKRRVMLLSLTMAAAAILDAVVLFSTWIGLRLLLFVDGRASNSIDFAFEKQALAYLYPFPFDRSTVGGATSHISGVLTGLAKSSCQARIWTSRRLPSTYEQAVVPNRRRLFLLRESAICSYGLRFIANVGSQLRSIQPSTLYQRHGPYVVSGALLSLLHGIPLVLEYNGSEPWIAMHWDPSRFPGLVRLCEQLSLRRASLIVVVSDALKQELVSQGISEARILINANGVDPETFHAGCGGREILNHLGIDRDEVVVGFVGTFSYWHGIPVLQETILQLLNDDTATSYRLRFLLVGGGPLLAEIRSALSNYERNGRVIFTGLIPHSEVPAHIDACDILVSPHVRMPDGSAFFGSPTKLFEYMAMGKAIVASALDQIADVLEDGRSAMLVSPGSVTETARAIKTLAQNPELRSKLGSTAAEVARQTYTWRANAERLLAKIEGPDPRKNAAKRTVRTDTSQLPIDVVRQA